jgi:hypothetical protein
VRTIIGAVGEKALPTEKLALAIRIGRPRNARTIGPAVAAAATSTANPTKSLANCPDRL